MQKDGFSYNDLNIEINGPETGEPVVLLHGWGSSAQLMRPIAQALADRYRTYNIDLPGHGLSPFPPEPWGVPEYADLVVRYVAEQIGQPVTLIGHSNGGRIGLYLAGDGEAGRWLRRLVLVSPSGIKPRRGWKYYVRRTVATVLKAPFQILPKPLREFGLDWLRHSLVWRLLGSSDYRTLEGVMRETFVKTVNFYVHDRLAHIRVPVLLFWGDRDQAVSRYQMDVLKEGIKDSGLVVLEGAGHYGYLDTPGKFIGATRTFLEKT